MTSFDMNEIEHMSDYLESVNERHEEELDEAKSKMWQYIREIDDKVLATNLRSTLNPLFRDMLLREALARLLEKKE